MYYAVAKVPDRGGVGIYDDWKKAKPYCIDPVTDKPFKNARFKSFQAIEQAIDFMHLYAFQEDKQNHKVNNILSDNTGLGTQTIPLHCINDTYLLKSTKPTTTNNISSFAEQQSLNSQSNKRKREQEKKLSVTSGTKKAKGLRSDKEFLTTHKQPIEPSSMGSIISNETQLNNSTDDDGHQDNTVLIVYTDGACIDNGKRNARGGYGVYFGDNDERNEYGPLPNNGIQHTNQRAELTAILRALQITQHDTHPLIIYSDSMYSMQCLDEWLPKWRVNGFKTANNNAVKNVDLISEIDRLITERGRENFEFRYVKGHNGYSGNEAADRLACLGAKMA